MKFLHSAPIVRKTVLVFITVPLLHQNVVFDTPPVARGEVTAPVDVFVTQGLTCDPGMWRPVTKIKLESVGGGQKSVDFI